MLRTAVLVLLVAFATAEQTSFKNYKVFKVTPANDDQLDLLKKLQLNFEDYEYWQEPSMLYQPAHIMVNPHSLPEFTELLRANQIDNEMIVADVQTLIDEQNPKKLDSEAFALDKYHTLEEIYDWLDTLPKQYPGKAEVVVGGSTYERRDIKGVKINFGANKPSIIIDGGAHAREWIAPATVVYLIDALLRSTDPEVRALAEDHEWHLFPVFNPDGYVHSHTKNRLWRKTRSPGFLICKGVDPNRNWDYKWMEGGASKNPCMGSYAGKKPFSEIETKSFSDYMRSIGSSLFAYISFHNFSQLLLFPYGHTKEHLENYDELSAIANKTVEALAKRYGTEYKYGNIAETIYISSGSSIDWAKAVLKLPIAYGYELRSQAIVPGFFLPAREIIPNGEEVLDSLVAMFKEAKNFGYPKTQQ